MPQVTTLADLPFLGSSHEMEGYLTGEAPITLIFFDGAPGSGPKLHRHPYAEIFIVQEGTATFTVGDETFEVHGGRSPWPRRACRTCLSIPARGSSNRSIFT